MALKTIYVPSTRVGAAIFSPTTEMAQAKKQYEAGYPIGVVDALFLCLEVGHSPPSWVEDHFPANLLKVLGLSTEKQKGRKSRPAQQLRDDLLHFHRYDAVGRARIAGLKGEQKLQHAQALLKGTTSEGSIPSIKKSYSIVKNAIKSTNGMARFRYPRSTFVSNLVLRSGKKFASTKG